MKPTHFRNPANGRDYPYTPELETRQDFIPIIKKGDKIKVLGQAVVPTGKKEKKKYLKHVVTGAVFPWSELLSENPNLVPVDSKDEIIGTQEVLASKPKEQYTLDDWAKAEEVEPEYEVVKEISNEEKEMNEMKRGTLLREAKLLGIRVDRYEKKQELIRKILEVRNGQNGD